VTHGIHSTWTWPVCVHCGQCGPSRRHVVYTDRLHTRRYSSVTIC